MLRLLDKPVLAKGKHQHVYAHPDDPTLLVKVPQPGTFDALGHVPKTSRTKRFFCRATMYKCFLREFREYLELKARQQEPGMPLPVCEVHGTVPTDIGLGLVYQRISAPDGSLSPSLKHMIETGQLETRHVPLIHSLFDELIEKHIVVDDRNLDNIVFYEPEPGRGRFIWIDGFGSNQALPLRKWFKQLNARRLEKVRRKFVGRAEEALATRSEDARIVHHSPDASPYNARA